MAARQRINITSRNYGQFGSLVRQRLELITDTFYRRLANDSGKTVNYIRRRTPKRTGNLRRSVFATLDRRGRWSAVYRAGYGPTGYYAQWVPAARNIVNGKKLQSQIRRTVRKSLNDAIKEVEGRG